MTRRHWAILGSCVVVAIVSIAIRSWQPSEPTANVLVRATTEQSSVPGYAGTSFAEVAAPIRDERELDAFVRKLEADARRTGVLSAQATKLGYAAVRELQPELGPDRTRARALELSRTFRRIRRELEIAPVQQRLVALRAEATAATDRGSRERIAREYSLAASALPEPYRLEALDKRP